MIKPLSELVEPGWAHALADVEPTIHHMGDFLRAENAAGRPWLPASHNILRAFTIPFDSIKVLIVGQDPYPTPGHPASSEVMHSPSRQVMMSGFSERMRITLGVEHRARWGNL